MTDSAAPSIIVMKFGGTSVATPDGRAALGERVREALEADKAPVVVVSAMGRRGAPYATDTLLDLVSGLPGDERETDLLSSVGEIVSSIVVAHELRAAGIDARAFTGAEAGIITDEAHGGASVTEIHTGPLMSALEAGAVPVVCGFQGVSMTGATTTLGRGGSDTTACALGVALAADEVHIYTDVDGVMTADPRICEGAEVLEVIRSDELFQMARHGSRVVHTPAAELALESGLSVKVRNTYSDHPGTKVADMTAYRPASVATAVTSSGDVVRITASIPGEEGSPDRMEAQARVFRAMADADVSLDMFTPFQGSLAFTVTASSCQRATSALEDEGVAYATRDHLAKVTLIGAGMHGVPGVMAKVARHLASAGIDILQVADSHTTISVLVSADDAARAVQVLHDAFLTDR